MNGLAERSRRNRLCNDRFTGRPENVGSSGAAPTFSSCIAGVRGRGPPIELHAGRQDVEWIAVPKIEGDEALYTDFEGKNLGFGIDYASFLANNKFLEANPPVNALFEAMSIDVNDVSAEAQRQQQGETKIDQIKQHADAWIAANQATFDGWVDKACAVK